MHRSLILAGAELAQAARDAHARAPPRRRPDGP